MKKLLICILTLLPLAASQAVAQTAVANGENRDMGAYYDDQEDEIGNFDFLYGETEENRSEAMVESIMQEAFSHLGARYRHGSKGPYTFDCSGFTQYVYKQQMGVLLGASSRDQYARLTPVSRTDLQRGDLVFFTSPKSGKNVGHVGIVVDVNPLTNSFSFIHASSTTGVKVSESTESYYVRRYVGARRVR